MSVTKIREGIADLRTVQNLNSREASIIQNGKTLLLLISVVVHCLLTFQLEKQRAEILDWLYSEDFRTMHENISNRRKARTGDWIFEKNEFRNWIQMIDPHRILWGYGIRTYSWVKTLPMVFTDYRKSFSRRRKDFSIVYTPNIIPTY